MSRPEKTAYLLAQQGKNADAIQNARLNFAADPVYAHIATLSTAGAINGISWDIEDGRRGKRSLVAVRRRVGKRDGRLHGKPSSISTKLSAEAGVNISSEIRFRQKSHNARAFPYSIDRTLTKPGHRVLEIHNNEMASSGILLERKPTATYGSAGLRIGVVAVHSRWASLKPTVIEVVNETTEPEAFRPITRLLEQVADLEFPSQDNDQSYGNSITRTRNEVTITNDPTQHFAFHEALGVPGEVVSIARQNFGALVEHMQLPYRLPGT